MALGDEFKSSGITEATPGNVLFGAGTVHAGLEFKTNGGTGAWNFAESLLCATNGGSKVSITKELYDVPVDGALVKIKDLAVKVGETATMEIKPVEQTPEILKKTVIADEAASTTATGYTELKSRAQIKTGDYVQNLGFVGKRLDGTPIIFVFDYALCTSGWEVETQNKEVATPTLTFECYAPLTSEADTLPWHIYYPTPAGA